MRVDDDHLYHGAALVQIAEDPQFTAINSFKLANGVCRSAYRINDDIGVYLKYATKPTPAHLEYCFTFRQEHLDELEEIAKVAAKVFVALVCVKAREVCCLWYEDLLKLVSRRQDAMGPREDQYLVLATLPPKKKFRVYVNEPGTRNTMIGKPLLVSRTGFPRAIFT